MKNSFIVTEYINNGNLSKVCKGYYNNEIVIAKQPLFRDYYDLEKNSLLYAVNNFTPNVFPNIHTYSDKDSIIIMEYLGERPSFNFCNDKIYQNLELLYNSLIPSFCNSFFDTFVNKTLNRISETDRGDYLIITYNYKKNIIKRYKELSKESLKLEPDVLLHGDLWCDNIFGNYFIDPLFCYGSRYMELGYFISDYTLKEGCGNLDIKKECLNFVSKRMKLDTKLLEECVALFDYIYCLRFDF